MMPISMARTLSILLLGAAALAASLAASPAPALAQGEAKPASVEENKAAARELANKGYELFQAGNYKEAVQYFRDADAKFHAPTLLIMQARAHEKLGEMIEARGAYTQIVREPLPENASKEFKQARADAEEALNKIKGRIPKLKIVLKGATTEKVQITIDNIPVAGSILERPMEVNPGLRKVVATIETAEGGGRTVYQNVTMREARIKQITIVLRPGGGAMVQPVKEDEPIDDDDGGSWVPAGIAFGLGAAGVGVGVVTGVLWLNERDHIKEKCPNGDACVPEVKGNVDKAGTLGIAAIVGFAAGGVGLTVGTILAVTRGSSKKQLDEGRTGVTSVAVGPGSLLVRGAF
jgi:hypothetical protein